MITHNRTDGHHRPPNLRPARYPKSAVIALGAGLTLTLAATTSAHLGRAEIGGHIHSGYPGYGAAEIADGVSFYLTYLSVLGALGILGWAVTLWATAKGKHQARRIALVLFLAGTSVALFNLFVTDTSGETGLPPLIAGIGLLPSAAGLVAVMLMRRPKTASAKVATTPEPKHTQTHRNSTKG